MISPQRSPATPGWPGPVCVQDMHRGMVLVSVVSSVVTAGLSTPVMHPGLRNVVTSPRYLTFLTRLTRDNGDMRAMWAMRTRNLQ